ncbi:MAG: TetR/AcrR family transcriptional regulator [Spirochaetota bacterium]
MGPRAVFTREQIIEGGVDLIRTQGADTLSVRNVAAHIGSSTQPLYRLFGSSEAFEHELCRHVMEMMLDTMMTTHDAASSFLGIGIGFLTFAKAEPNLFRFLFFSGRRSAGALFDGIMSDALRGKMREDHMLCGFDDAVLERLLRDMALYSLGIAAEICFEKDTGSMEEYRKMLEETGGRLMIAEYCMRHPHTTYHEIGRKKNEHHGM